MPFVCGGLSLAVLALGAFLGRDRHSYSLSQLGQILLHLNHRLLENLFGVFGFIN
jgi:hypothetical protein